MKLSRRSLMGGAIGAAVVPMWSHACLAFEYPGGDRPDARKCEQRRSG
jgi:hypothetical protein